MKLLKSISSQLVLEPSYIEDVAKTASLRYTSFPINKKDGGTREIHHPAKEVKAIQRFLHEEYLTKLITHKVAVAYKQGTSIKVNANAHKEAKYLMRLDFRSFFSSISSTDVFNFISTNGENLIEGWSKDDSSLFTKLVCYKNSLTIGSVTSPMLTNAMCYNLDVKIFAIATSLGVTYTRYADDMYFSTSTPHILSKLQKQVFTIVKELQLPRKLKINHKKTHHSSKKNRMIVTGLVITTDNKVSIGRNKKREIRSLIFNWKKLEPKQKTYLAGYLSYCKSIEPTFINALCNKYGSNILQEIATY
jgi:RNA-directed DNA polymerase